MIGTCRALIASLGDYHEHSLSAAQHAAVDRHLQGCPYCRDYLRTYRATIELCQLLATRAPEPEAYQADDEQAARTESLVEEMLRRLTAQP